MAEGWSREEVEATVADYFEMLADELAGQPVNKKEHNRALQRLVRRSAGSIEFKHQNISAILIELGCRYVDGYKPRYNYQALLKEVVIERIENSPSLGSILSAAADQPVSTASDRRNLLKIVVAPPKFPERTPRTGASIVREAGVAFDYAEREQKNRSLGAAGEELAMQYEEERLWSLGRKDLAKEIERVSVTRGDGLGFDLRSFEKDGGERLIEVKTTRAGVMTPFYVSRNEVRVSEAKAKVYHVYRLHRFGADPKMYIVRGALSNTCELEGTQFRARVK